jgi:hypothetical protein
MIDRDHDGGYLATKYSDYRHVTLSDSSFEQHIEALTTDTDEAERLLSADLLRNLLKLSDAVRHAKNQISHTDDKVAYAIFSIAKGLSDLLAAVLTSAVTWFKTGSFKSPASRHVQPTAETPIAGDALALNAAVHCAFYDDKVLISIPNEHDLFEPDTLFRPPLHGDDIKLAYDLMSMVKGLGKSVIGSLPKAELR